MTPARCPAPLFFIPPLTSTGTSAAQVSPPPGSGEGCGDPWLLGFFSYGAGIWEMPLPLSIMGDTCSDFRREMMNRAMHAAARGGDLEILRELLQGCTIAAAYQDAQGATILHVAASRGQVERDSHGWPMPERRRPRTRRRPDPLHAIHISSETCTKSGTSSARATLGPRPAALQPERFSRLAPEVEERSSLPRASLAPANQQADPASFSLPSFLLPPAAWPLSRAWLWRTQLDKGI